MRIFGLGPTELLIILAIVLLLFGPKQIPKLSRMFGKAVKDVREGFEAGEKEADEEKKPEAITAADSDSSTAEAKKSEDAQV